MWQNWQNRIINEAVKYGYQTESMHRSEAEYILKGKIPDKFKGKSKTDLVAMAKEALKKVNKNRADFEAAKQARLPQKEEVQNVEESSIEDLLATMTDAEADMIRLGSKPSKFKNEDMAKLKIVADKVNARYDDKMRNLALAAHKRLKGQKTEEFSSLSEDSTYIDHAKKNLALSTKFAEQGRDKHNSTWGIGYRGYLRAFIAGNATKTPIPSDSKAGAGWTQAKKDLISLDTVTASEETEQAEPAIHEAYASTEIVSKIRELLKKRFPAFRFAVARQTGSYGTVRVYILSGPVMFSDDIKFKEINRYHLNDYKNSEILRKIMATINLEGEKNANYDHSDIRTDYFCVGYYINLYMGGQSKTKGVMDYVLTDRNGKPLDPKDKIPSMSESSIADLECEMEMYGDGTLEEEAFVKVGGVNFTPFKLDGISSYVIHFPGLGRIGYLRGMVNTKTTTLPATLNIQDTDPKFWGGDTKTMVKFWPVGVAYKPPLPTVDPSGVPNVLIAPKELLSNAAAWMGSNAQKIQHAIKDIHFDNVKNVREDVEGGVGVAGDPFVDKMKDLLTRMGFKNYLGVRKVGMSFYVSCKDEATADAMSAKLNKKLGEAGKIKKGSWFSKVIPIEPGDTAVKKHYVAPGTTHAVILNMANLTEAFTMQNLYDLRVLLMALISDESIAKTRTDMIMKKKPDTKKG